MSDINAKSDSINRISMSINPKPLEQIPREQNYQTESSSSELLVSFEIGKCDRYNIYIYGLILL